MFHPVWLLIHRRHVIRGDSATETAGDHSKGSLNSLGRVNLISELLRMGAAPAPQYFQSRRGSLGLGMRTDLILSSIA